MSGLVDLLVGTDTLVREAELPDDPFERQAVGSVALSLAGDLIAFVQRLNAEREPYVTTYSVEERVAHRRAALEPPQDPPPPPPPPPTEDTEDTASTTTTPPPSTSTSEGRGHDQPRGY